MGGPRLTKEEIEKEIDIVKDIQHYSKELKNFSAIRNLK
jgi:hypothetical protein